MNLPATTFRVSEVELATKPLPEVSYVEAINHLLRDSLGRVKRQMRDDIHVDMKHSAVSQESNDEQQARLEERLPVMVAKERASTRSIEACSRYHGRLVANVLGHPVILCLHHAFVQHRPICLSPDIVWLLICQGVADHVNVHSEALRPRFVQHQGKAQIEVRRDDFMKGSPENPWGEVIDELSRLIREHVGSAHDLFVPRFSTTTPTTRIAAEIVLLDAMKSYFQYRFSSMCGIPAITLEGTVDDWQELAERVEAFARFDLKWWVPRLRPILREFVATARGDVRINFWRSIYKFENYSGGGAISGWIAAFFPYLKDPTGCATERNPWLVKGGWKLRRLLAGKFDERRWDLGGPSLGDFPSGVARAPFVWNHLGQRFDMEFLGGFVGVAQDSATLVLKPEIGWAVGPEVAG